MSAGQKVWNLPFGKRPVLDFEVNAARIEVLPVAAGESARIECRRPGAPLELRTAGEKVMVRLHGNWEGDLDLGSAIDRPLHLSSNGDGQTLRIPVGTPLAEAERWMIMATLRKCEGNKTRAAALLGVSLKTLYNRLHAYRAQGFDGSDTDRELIEVAN